VQTTRLAESFELLTGSVALARPEIFPRKVMCDPAVFALKKVKILKSQFESNFKMNYFIHYLCDLWENGDKNSFSVITFFRMK